MMKSILKIMITSFVTVILFLIVSDIVYEVVDLKSKWLSRGIAASIIFAAILLIYIFSKMHKKVSHSR